MTRDPAISTEQAILDAAERLFLAKGFAMTSTTEIAKVAGCNQALVHYYYRTKERLFEAVFERKFALFVSVFSQDQGSPLPFESRIASLVGAHFEVLRANPRLPFLILNELLTNEKRLEEMSINLAPVMEKALAALQAELDTEADKGMIRRIAAIDLAMTVVSLNAFFFLMNPIYSVLAKKGEMEREWMIEHRKQENVELVMKYLRIGA